MDKQPWLALSLTRIIMSLDEPILIAAKELDVMITGQDTSGVKQLLAEKDQ
jgi:hypothetical protein